MAVLNLVPLEQWVCDTCGELIRDVEGAYVQFARVNGVARDFRIVHHKAASPRPSGCYGPRELSDLQMSRLRGDDGLAVLLGLLEPGPAMLPQVRADAVSWAELFRRVRLPRYEEARQFFAAAEGAGVWPDGRHESSAYSQQALAEVLEVRSAHALCGELRRTHAAHDRGAALERSRAASGLALCQEGRHGPPLAGPSGASIAARRQPGRPPAVGLRTLLS